MQWNNTSSNPYSILLLFLASVIYHECWIKECISKNPNHSFMKIPIINDDNLLNELRNKISIKPSNIIRRATGIPLYIETAIVMHKLINITMQTLEEVKNLTINMCVAISDAIDAKSLENGQVSASKVKNLLNNFKEKY